MMATFPGRTKPKKQNFLPSNRPHQYTQGEGGVGTEARSRKMRVLTEINADKKRL